MPVIAFDRRAIFYLEENDNDDRVAMAPTSVHVWRDLPLVGIPHNHRP